MTASGLMKWTHPQTGEQFTFQDCRPGAKAAEPDDNDTLAAFEIITKAMVGAPRSRRPARGCRNVVRPPSD